MATIATHNGSAVRQAHNLRAASCLAKEKHIDPTRPHEVWHHETINHAYHRLFDQARADYNAKQKRQDRKLTGSYLAEIEKDQKKHPCYEMIIGVYGNEVSETLSKRILKDFAKSWQDRNPSLELIGAYFHADEEGKNPHVHLDYIPVAHGYQRGPETQTGLVKALEQQGFVKKGKSTAQIQWEARENAYLESLCRERGLAVEHPNSGEKQLKHIETRIYKAEQQAREYELQTQRAQQLAEQELEHVREAKRKAAKTEQTADKLKNLIERQLDAIEMTAQDRLPVKRKIGGREVVEIDPKDLAQLQDAAAYVREAFEIKSQCNKLIEQAKKEASSIISEAKKEMDRDWFEHKLIGIQIEQIRKDWPQLNVYFDSKGTYRGRDWLNKQQQQENKHERHISKKDDFER